MVNFNQLMKQAQAMQSKMQEIQASIESAEYEGKAGGNMVTVKISGKGAMKSISIDKAAIDPEDKELLEDLIVAAYNDAKAKADDASQSAMTGAMGGMPLPPGFNVSILLPLKKFSKI